MPFRRRYRRRFRSRKSFYSKVKTIANAVVKKNIETKYISFNPNAGVISNNAIGSSLTVDLNTMGTGSGPSTRTGNQVRTTGYHGKFVVTGADATNIVRFVLYIPKNTGDDLKLDGTEVYSDIDQDKYTVLKDFFVSTSANGPDTKQISLRGKFNSGKRSGILTQFNGNTSSTCMKGLLKLYAVSDSGVTSHPTLTGHMRIYYKDG